MFKGAADGVCAAGERGLVIEIVGSIRSSELAVFVNKARLLQELSRSSTIPSQGAIKQGWSREFSGKLFKGVSRDSVPALVTVAVVSPGDGKVQQHIGNALANAFAQKLDRRIALPSTAAPAPAVG
ncbi:MAG: hypothetical protein EBY66_00555 [Candidatus Fonsibacter lacus]|nr:hypothetical protein [Candidatus Fonsibacter lacus]